MRASRKTTRRARGQDGGRRAALRRSGGPCAVRPPRLVRYGSRAALSCFPPSPAARMTHRGRLTRARTDGISAQRPHQTPAADIALAAFPAQRAGCGSIGLRGDFRLPAPGDKAQHVESRLPVPSRVRLSSRHRRCAVGAGSGGQRDVFRNWPLRIGVPSGWGVAGGGTPDPWLS